MYMDVYEQQKQNLALHAEGIKMTLASEKPHLLMIDGTSTLGVVLYYLQVTYVISYTIIMYVIMHMV